LATIYTEKGIKWRKYILNENAKYKFFGIDSKTAIFKFKMAFKRSGVSQRDSFGTLLLSSTNVAVMQLLFLHTQLSYFFFQP
jgi:hypothetical protein